MFNCSLETCTIVGNLSFKSTINNKTTNPIHVGNSNSSDGSNTILSNVERSRTSFFEHRMNSNTLFLASNNQTSNFELDKAFTRFTKLLFELTRTSLFRKPKELERFHLLVIELEHPIFGFEHCLTNH